MFTQLKVSLIVATYNSEKNIKTCIESIISQNYPNIEIVVIDGASKDNTLKVISDLLNDQKQVTSQVISEKDNGIYDALNKGIKNAMGDIIGFVHSDDALASPTVISSIVENFETHNCDGVYGNLHYVASNDLNRTVRNWQSKPFKRSYLKYGWMPAHPTLYLRKKCYDETGLFNTNYQIAADYDFILRTFKNPNYTFVFLNEIITLMRLGGASNKNVANVIQKMKEDLRALRTNHIGGIFSLFSKNVRKLMQFKFV